MSGVITNLPFGIRWPDASLPRILVVGDACRRREPHLIDAAEHAVAEAVRKQRKS